MAIQGIKEISLIIGIDEQDFERAIRLLYEFAKAKNKELRP
jgi:translation initiation factor IF-3